MPDNVFCSKCGAQNSGAAQFCQNCGGTLWPAPATAAAPMQPGSPQPAQMQPAGYAPQPAIYAQPVASPYAGFWIRFVAHLIDGIVIGIVAAPLYFLLVFPTIIRIINEAQQNGGEPSPEMIASIFGGMSVFLLLAFAGQWLYDALLTSSSWQGTIGKRVLKLKVVDEQGNRVSFGRATGRYFSKIISGMVMYVGFIMIAFTDRKRGLHDMIAGTLVMKY
jgi:uncharacterized RDD family membrane protein YckC